MASAASTDPAQTIATMRPREHVDGVFACTRKERQITRSGSPYLTLELRDSSGTILARAFRDADLLAGRFERGELVRVAGRVERFREQLQIDVETIARAEGQEADPTRFLPASYRDLDELEGFVEHLAREVYEPGLRGLLDSLLAGRELRRLMRIAPCSVPAPPGAARGAGAGAHHAYLGGLLEHTVAVATMAIELCTLHPRLDRDLLVCAALVHDIGKTREFTYGAEIARSREGALLGHVELGLRLIAAHAPATLAPERLLELEHCVICHHGAEQAGQRFASAEALALHRLNALDAHLKGAIEHGLGRPAGAAPARAGAREAAGTA